MEWSQEMSWTEMKKYNISHKYVNWFTFKSSAELNTKITENTFNK